MGENPRPITIEEYRERRKPFPFTSSKGITFLLQPLSIISLVAAGAMPNELITVALSVSKDGKLKHSKIEENTVESMQLIENIIIKGAVEPKITRQKSEDSIGIDEIEDNLKIELFYAVLGGDPQKDKGEDLRPFPANAGGGADGAGGAVLGSEAE